MVVPSSFAYQRKKMIERYLLIALMYLLFYTGDLISRIMNLNVLSDVDDDILWEILFQSYSKCMCLSVDIDDYLELNGTHLWSKVQEHEEL